MSIATLSPPQTTTLAELLEQLGDIPLERIRVHPPIGTATEDDLLAVIEAADKRLVELIDGVLVEKPMGFTEAFLAGYILRIVGNFLESNDLGIVAGADGPFRILERQIRLPDVSVLLWESLPSRSLPKEKVPRIIPDLTVEVISESNTRKEIKRKLRDYFKAGVKEVWVVYPKTKSARIYIAPEKYKRIAMSQSLTSEEMLPGFELPLVKLFELLPIEENGKK